MGPSLSLCRESSRCTPSTHSSADDASNTTVSFTVMACSIFNIVLNARAVATTTPKSIFFHCASLHHIRLCVFSTQPFMQLPMFTRGRARRSTSWRNRAVKTVSCCRFALISVCECVWFSPFPVVVDPWCCSSRKGQRSLWIRICWGRRGPGGTAGSRVLTSPPALDRLSLLRRASRGTVITRPRPLRVRMCLLWKQIC